MIAINLNELTIKRRDGITNQDLYIMIKNMWRFNNELRKYPFPLIAHRNPLSKDLVLTQDYDWNVEGAEQE